MSRAVQACIVITTAAVVAATASTACLWLRPPALARAADRPATETAIESPSPFPLPEQRREAAAILADRVAGDPALRGVTVEFGATPGGYQAVAYYRTGRIVIDPGHEAPLVRIVDHELGHIADWRADGRIDRDDSGR